MSDAITVRRTTRALPAEQAAALQRARHLCIWTLVSMAGVCVLMYAVMAGSQAMKTALVEDLLSLLPSACFLVAAWFRTRPCDGEYINGRERAFDVNFLIASVALTGVGLGLLIDGTHTLLTRSHPVIGTVEIGGTVVWQGWLMIAALAISAVPPVILGRLKLRLADTLSLKPLRTDAAMQKADWMTALAGIAGIVGIGFGWWWADAAAAILISGSVLHDGGTNLLGAVRDMHDARPEQLERDREDPLVGRAHAAVRDLDWVRDCRVRFHEEGMRLSGVVCVVAQDGMLDEDRRLSACEAVRDVHWRFDDVVVTLLEADRRRG